jgi:sulfhydrogenase subunit beta (sulfur reductase)
MENKIMEKKEFSNFIQHLIESKKWEVVGVKSREEKFIFAPLENAGELRLDYDVTILPPKKYFSPPKENLLSFIPRDSSSCKAVKESMPRIIVGIHPYDLAAISLMDKFFHDKELDTPYKNRRENTILIGSTPQVPYKNRFFRSMISDDKLIKHDLMVTDIGSKYVIEVGSEKGSGLLKNFVKVSVAEDKDMKRLKEVKESVADGQKLNFDVKDLPGILAKNEGNAVWKERSDKCFSCGSCVFVCPTCHCFDVQEDLDISFGTGKRMRVWDSCMLKDFALVAGGHNFRKEKQDRFAHRFYKKGKYLFEKYGQPGCVGCGRCVSACVPDIANPAEVYNKL